MNKDRSNLLIVTRLCSIFLLTSLITASAQAQTGRCRGSKRQPRRSKPHTGTDTAVQAAARAFSRPPALCEHEYKDRARSDGADGRV